MLATLVVLTLFVNGAASPVSHHLDDGACQAAFRSISAQRIADGLTDPIGHACSETVLMQSVPGADSLDGALARVESANRMLAETARLRDLVRDADPAVKELAAMQLDNSRIAERTRMRDTVREMDPATKAAIGASPAIQVGR